MASNATAIKLERAEGTSENQWKTVLRRFTRHRIALICAILFTIILVISFMAPWIAPYPRDDIQLGRTFVPPFSTSETGTYHLLGTDHIGRDLWTRVLYAGRISLTIAISVQITASLIGITFGLIAGYFGGWVDRAITAFYEFVSTFPTTTILLIAAAVALQSEASIPVPDFMVTAVAWIMAIPEREARLVALVMIILALLGWTGTARLTRGMVLTVRENIYIEASRALGGSHSRVIARHVLPNALPPLLVDFTLNLNGILVAEAILSALGFGVQDPTPTWGNMLAVAQSYMFNHSWMPIIPSLPILICSLAINYVGDGLRDALDPRSKL
jgi:peptide/nickel transport system permease protein